ncbi:MAG TPA: hypothetical protein VLG92_01205 [Candidatus Saccharimonadia bacterium]|nr:hypothetical protein [Candidatus Saccharimonadia bacterium]
MDAKYSVTGNEYDDDPDDELNEHWHEPGDPDGLVAEEERHSQEQSLRPKGFSGANAQTGEQNGKSKRFWKVVLGLLVLIMAAGAAYWFGSQRAAVPAKKPVGQTSQHSQTTQNVIAPTTHYDSTIYAIGIDYPNNWVTSDTAQKLTITSPNIAMQATSGQTTGHITVTIQNQQTTLVSFPTAGATASLASDKLTYKQPTAVQRAQTYLSYLGYTSGNELDALYLTGDNGYQQSQTIPMTDVVKGNPLVSVTFSTCGVSYCTKGTPTPVALKATSWQNASFRTTVLNILQSLTIN